MSTGVEEKALSGRSDVTKEPIIEDIVGGESSEISWYALNTRFQGRTFRKVSVTASPYGGRYCKLGSPAHLAQYLNVRDFSGVAEKRVELCRIRLVEI